MITATCSNEDCARYNEAVTVRRSPSVVECGTCGRETDLSNPQDDPAPPVVPAANLKRRDRDDALAASDFRMVSDAPWDTAAWATYRQALRDLPDHADWPDVDLPTPPGGDS